MPTKTIPVYVRTVYGTPHVYAANAEQARHLATLTGAKTITPRHGEALRALGFTLEPVRDPEATLASDLFALGASFHLPNEASPHGPSRSHA